MVLEVMYLECRGRIFTCGINRQYYVEWLFVGLFRWILQNCIKVASLSGRSSPIYEYHGTASSACTVELIVPPLRDD